MADLLTSPWLITYRDAALIEQGSCAGYDSFELDLKWLDVGTWRLSMPPNHPALAVLSQRGSGIVVRASGSATVLASGFVTDLTASYVGGQLAGVDLAGVTDEAVLAGENNYPSPTFDVPLGAAYQWPAQTDDRTGAGETVLLGYIGDNIGPAAGVARRRYPWLVLPTTQGRGTSINRSERGTNLLDLAKSICLQSGLSFSVTQGDPGFLNFNVTVPQMRIESRFSPQAGNLNEFQVKRLAPQADEAIVMGQSALGTRTFIRRVATGAPAWVYRRSRWIDQSSSTDIIEQLQAADEQLLSDGENTTATLSGIDVPNNRFGVHYFLGDKVTAGVSGSASTLLGLVEVNDVVTEVVVEHASGSPTTTTVTIGFAEDDTAASDATLRRLANDLLATLRR
jgi:hypothetical protein